jgi:HK97 family phage major capsid protein
MLKELLEKLARERAQMKKIFDQAGAEMDMAKVTEIAGTEQEKLKEIRRRNEGLGELQKQVDGLVDLEKARGANEELIKKQLESARPDMPGSKGAAREERVEEKSFIDIGSAFVKANAHKKENRGKAIKLAEGVNLKTLFSTGAGWAPQSLRTGLVVPFAVRPIQIIDLIPPGQTTMAAIKYMEETLVTDAAAETAEGGAYAEAAFALTERNVIVDKIAVFVPMTDEQLEDVPQAESYINNRLPAMIMRRLDSQLLNGDGNAPNLLGLLNKAGILNQAPTNGDGSADTIYRAITAVALTGRAIASGIIMHHTDWLNERLRKTAQGNYVWGSPAEVGPERMWGLPVAKSDILAAGTAVVGDFRTYAQLVERQGIEVETGYVNDDFIKGRQAVRADMRCAALWLRPAAFSKVTLPVLP